VDRRLYAGIICGGVLGASLTITIAWLVAPRWCPVGVEAHEPPSLPAESHPLTAPPLAASSIGPMEWLRDRFDRLNRSLEQAQVVLRQLGAVLQFGWSLISTAGVDVLFFLALSLLLTAGINQLRILSPPWPLLSGAALSAWIWYAVARVVTAGQSSGSGTILRGAAVVLGPYLAIWSWRWLWRQRFRVRAHAGGDPFAVENLAATLALVDEVSRFGHHALSLRGLERELAAARGQTAQQALMTRLRAAEHRHFPESLAAQQTNAEKKD
jgi:hypothetical protein